MGSVEPEKAVNITCRGMSPGLQALPVLSSGARKLAGPIPGHGVPSGYVQPTMTPPYRATVTELLHFGYKYQERAPCLHKQVTTTCQNSEKYKLINNLLCQSIMA